MTRATDAFDGSSTHPTSDASAAAGTGGPSPRAGAGSTGQAPAPTSRVIASLLADHMMVEGLFQRFEALSGSTGGDADARRRQLVDQMIRALAVHALIEEQVVYPVMATALPDGRQEWREALAEQQRQKQLLAELERTPVTSPTFVGKVEALIGETRAHVQEEETDLFPRLEEAVPTQQLAAMAVALETARLLAPTHPHPSAPNTPPWNVLAGLSVAPVDWTRDLLGAAVRAGRARSGPRR